jgi:hypothetical protein
MPKPEDSNPQLITIKGNEIRNGDIIYEKIYLIMTNLTIPQLKNLRL